MMTGWIASGLGGCEELMIVVRVGSTVMLLMLGVMMVHHC